MKNFTHLLQINLNFHDYKFGLICFITAFLVAMIGIPPLISFLKKYKFYDLPGDRKAHNLPIPNMGGIAIAVGMMTALLFWFPFTRQAQEICFFLSIFIMLALGIMDDVKDLPARYKLIIQTALAVLVATSGSRITYLYGLFGMYELPLLAQYTFTIIAIVGVTNAFNLIDGVDGLAGGLGFMSLMILGIFLTVSGDLSSALIAFALAGGILAFLYYNVNPARIFMGDAGSLMLGFVIAVLCIKLMQANILPDKSVMNNIPVFVLGIVLIPVFDTIRVFSIRIWNGKSPFTADNSHLHHLLIRAGASHLQTTGIICGVHGFIFLEIYWLQDYRQEIIFAIVILLMILVTFIFKNAEILFKKLGSIRSALFLKK